MTPGDKWFGLEGCEHLLSDIDDVVESVVDQRELGAEPETVAVLEFAPKKVKLSADDILETVYDRLYDAYVSDCHDAPGIPDSVRAIANALAEEIVRTYPVSVCEPTGVKHEINVAEWLKGRGDA